MYGDEQRSQRSQRYKLKTKGMINKHNYIENEKTNGIDFRCNFHLGYDILLRESANPPPYEGHTPLSGMNVLKLEEDRRVKRIPMNK